MWFFLPFVLLGQPSQPNTSGVDATQRNLLLTTLLTSTLQKELSRAATAGYRVVAASKAYEYFPDFLILLERVAEPPATYQYLVVATYRASTFEKELREAGAVGFRLLPHTMMVTPPEQIGELGGQEIFAVMEKAPNSTNEYEYRVVVTSTEYDYNPRTETVDVSTHKGQLETEILRAVLEGYTVTGMVSRGDEKIWGTVHVQHIVVAEKPKRTPPLRPGAGSRPDVLQRYLVLHSYPGAGLQEQLEQAADKGYCLRLTSVLAFPAIVAILEKAAQPPDGCQYLFLRSPQGWSLDNQLQGAGAQGFRPHPAGIFQSPLVVIMEKSPGGADRFQYVLIETNNFSKFKKQFAEASAQGYRVVGASRTGKIPMLILEKPAEARAESGVVATQPSKEAPAAPAELPKPERSRRQLSLRAIETSTLQWELNRAAGWGYRLLTASVVPVEPPWDERNGREISLNLEKVAGPPNTYEYLVLATRRQSTLQKELNEAAARGFRVVPGTIMMKPPLHNEPYDEYMLVMEKAPGSPVHYRYLILSTMRDSTLEKGIRQARAQGYEVAGRLGRHNTAILERAVPQ